MTHDGIQNPAPSGRTKAMMIYLCILLFVFYELVFTLAYTPVFAFRHMELPRVYAPFAAFATAVAAYPPLSVAALLLLGAVLFRFGNHPRMARHWDPLMTGLGLLLITGFCCTVIPATMIEV